MKKLLVIEVAGLGFEFAANNGLRALARLPLQPLHPVFPALTCTAQATLRTGLPPSDHGMVANGFYDPILRKTFFWEQSAALVSGPRIWQDFRARGGTVGMAFFQQSLGEQTDILLSPAPVHTHGGSMIMECASQPPDLYKRLSRSVGRPFRLHRYWGPLASTASSDWIAAAVAKLLTSPDAPDLCFAYLPGLDYDLQRFGPAHPKSVRALAQVSKELTMLFSTARANGYETVAFGDYAITPISNGAVFPNRALRDSGLFATRNIKGMHYPDFHNSRAFALVDHQIATINCSDHASITLAKNTLINLKGVGQILDREAQTALGVAHLRAGDLLLVAEPGAWFAYPWWTAPREAPDYAAHVDIHNKPGYDPCELFFGKTPLSVSLDTAKVRGTHGRIGPGLETACFSTLPLKPESLAELSREIKDWLQ